MNECKEINAYINSRSFAEILVKSALLFNHSNKKNPFSFPKLPKPPTQSPIPNPQSPTQPNQPSLSSLPSCPKPQ